MIVDWPLACWFVKLSQQVRHEHNSTTTTTTQSIRSLIVTRKYDQNTGWAKKECSYTNHVRWASYISSGCKFLIVCMCQKLWKLAGSRQSYCKKLSGLLFGPPCMSQKRLILSFVVQWRSEGGAVGGVTPLELHHIRTLV